MDLLPGLSPDLKAKLFQSLFVFAVLYLIRFFASKLVINKIHDNQSRYRWQRAISIITNFLILIIVARIWFNGIDSIATYFGFLTAGLAIALKDVISNLAGSAFIVSRKPFEIGDRVQIGEYSGDVIDIRLFQFTLLEIGKWVDGDQTTGRIVHVPSGTVFTTSQINFNQAFSHIWNEIPVLITFESNWRQAKKILKEIIDQKEFRINNLTQRKLRQASLQYMLPFESFESNVFITVKDSGVLFTVRYLCEPRARRRTEVEMWESILEAFEKNNDIEFAYPTQRFYKAEPFEEQKPSPMEL